jgi:hypothetical protein
MDTHKILMITVIVLALVHLALSLYVYSKESKSNISAQQMKSFLLVSSVVCLIIAGLAAYCVSM